MSAIAPAADPTSRVFAVELAIPNEAQALKVGMIATVIVTGATDKSPMPSIPLAAVVKRPDGQSGHGVYADVKIVDGAGFAGLDGISSKPDSEIMALLDRFAREHSFQSELHPDTWAPIIVREPAGIRAALDAVAGDKYSYRELDKLPCPAVCCVRPRTKFLAGMSSYSRSPAASAAGPPNNGIWIWGNEILVGFMDGAFKRTDRGHAIDGSKPSYLRFGRSKDGGETWTVGEPLFLNGEEREQDLGDSPGGFDFTHPYSAVAFRMVSSRTG